jgi:hypothetical protein
LGERSAEGLILRDYSRTMSIEDWDKDEIKRLTLVSGKPLEVQCAEAFLKAGWEVRLGTFYNDVASERIRELDVLAERRELFLANGLNRDVVEWRFCLRVLGSCKGFAPEHGPVIYSVLTKSRSVEIPSLMCYETRPRGQLFSELMKHKGAHHFLHCTGLPSTQQVVGFDIFHRKEDQKKTPKVEYARKTDRDLYEGLDSALKAAVFWYREEKRQGRATFGTDKCCITVNIPLLISSLPFWQVSIEGGTPGEPVLTSAGFHVSLYPDVDKEKPPVPIMSVLWESGKLVELTQHLNMLFEYLIDEAKLMAKDI